jgi:peroxiredoxin Q/BCP
LISDSDETLCQLFDVLKPKNMYGKEVIGVERSTFLINAKGVLMHEWRKVKVDGHCLEVLERIGAI